MNKLTLKDRIKNNFRENKRVLLIFTALWILLYAGSIFIYGNTLGKESDGNYSLDRVIELSKDVELTQILPCKDGLESISLKYATYARKNSGTVYVEVIGNDSATVYLSSKKSFSSLQDNAYYTYKLSEVIDCSKDSRITINIHTNGQTGSSIGIYYSTTPYFEDGLFAINNERTEGELGIRTLVSNEEYSFFSNVIINCSVFLLYLITVSLFLLKPNLEYTFTIIALIVGLAFMVIISPGAPPDETLHYEQVLQVSNIVLGQDDSYIDSEYTNYDSFADHKNVSFSYTRLLRDIDEKLDLKNENYYFNARIDGLYLGYYIPQTIGVTVSRILGANMIITFYSGRLTNLLFYCLCIFIAIKNAPTRKMLFGIIAISPMFVQQAASYSYDNSVNALIFVSVAFLFKWLSSNEKIITKDIIVVFIVSAFLAPAKVVYGLFTLLYWFVPDNKFKNKKQKILISTLLSMPTVVLLTYNTFIRTIDMIFHILKVDGNNMLALENIDIVSDTQVIDGKDLYNMNYIIKHPIETVQIVLKTIRFYLSTWFYQTMGRSLAGSNLVIPMSFIRVILCCILFCSIREGEYVESLSLKISSLVVCVTVALLILATMLTGWTKRNDELIIGMQGRYFCPLLPYFFSVFNNKKIKLPKKLDNYAIFLMLAVSFEVIVYVLSYTFVN